MVFENSVSLNAPIDVAAAYLLAMQKVPVRLRLGAFSGVWESLGFRVLREHETTNSARRCPVQIRPRRLALRCGQTVRQLPVKETIAACEFESHGLRLRGTQSRGLAAKAAPLQGDDRRCESVRDYLNERRPGTPIGRAAWLNPDCAPAYTSAT